MPNFTELIESLASSDASTRNRAAIALMDLRDKAAIEPLIEAIERPANRNARGTLVYALSEFDCSERFAQLFRWALEGGYETSVEAISIIHNQQVRPACGDAAICHGWVESSRDQGGSDEELLDELSALLAVETSRGE